MRAATSCVAASKPEILTRIACDLARYFLFDGDNQRPTEQATKRYDDAIAYLTKVGTGAINLSLAQGQSTPPVSAGAPSFTGEARTFTTDTLRDCWSRRRYDARCDRSSDHGPHRGGQ